MKKLLFVMLLLWGGGGLGLWYYNESQSQQFTYRTVDVTRGDLLATINATGTIEPQEVVDVGAQIAGVDPELRQGPARPEPKVDQLPLSPVEEGTVLAQIADPLFKARVDQMKANLSTTLWLRSSNSLRRGWKQCTRRELDRSVILFREQGASLLPTEHDNTPWPTSRRPRQRVALSREWGRTRPRQPRGSRGQSVVHDDQVAGQRGDPRPPGQHRPDRRVEPERPLALPDRQGPEPDGNLGVGQRDRHRRHPRGAGRSGSPSPTSLPRGPSAGPSRRSVPTPA